MRPGLVSVTFKDSPCEEVIHHARRAGLQAIEWHGRNHVPHGDLSTARRIGQQTRSAGLAVAAYGSYYVLGQSEGAGLSFDRVLQTAEVLEAPMIRVWAGDQNPDAVSAADRAHILEEAGRVADLAAGRQIQVVFEFHQDTLTQTAKSCAALLTELGHPNIRTYWQPAPALDARQNRAELRRVLPWLVGLHVFHWGPTHRDRHPLAQGESAWTQYLELAGLRSGSLDVLLEFVKGGAVEQFHEDAAVLHRWLT